MTQMDYYPHAPEEERNHHGLAGFASFLGAIVGFALFGMWFVNTPPHDFPTGEEIEIVSGSSLQEITRTLADRRVVRSASFLQFAVHTGFSDQSVKAGIYEFPERVSAFEVASLITEGEYGVPLARITIPEGLRVSQMDAIVREAIPSIAVGAFTEAAAGHEGYLFPETYFVSESATAEEIVTLMRETFDDTLAKLEGEISASPHTQEDIIIMASILEAEANDLESKRMVAGILWERLRIGMPLQVDAAIVYALNKSGVELKPEDLKVDSPYNTYLYAGLTPTPISNPGFESITAALNPINSPYLYYITGDDGTFRYAKTFDEHKRNVAEYLRN